MTNAQGGEDRGEDREERLEGNDWLEDLNISRFLSFEIFTYLANQNNTF